jgi:hypothetical protein
MGTAEANKLTREGVEQMLDEILVGFQLRQPSDYFKDHPTDDVERNYLNLSSYSCY